MKKQFNTVGIAILGLFFAVIPMQESFGMYRSKRTYNHSRKQLKKNDFKNRNRWIKEERSKCYKNQTAQERQEVKQLLGALDKLEKLVQENGDNYSETIEKAIKDNPLIIPAIFNMCVSFFQNLKKHLLSPAANMAGEGIKIVMPLIVARILSKIIPGVEAYCQIDYTEILCKNFNPGSPGYPEGGCELRNSYWKYIGGSPHCQKLSNFPVRIKKWTCGGQPWRYDKHVYTWPACWHIAPDRRYGHSHDGNSTYMDTLHTLLGKNRDFDFSKYIIKLAGDAAIMAEEEDYPLLKTILITAAIVTGIALVTAGICGGLCCLYYYFNNKEKTENKEKLRKGKRDLSPKRTKPGAKKDLSEEYYDSSSEDWTEKTDDTTELST